MHININKAASTFHLDLTNKRGMVQFVLSRVCIVFRDTIVVLTCTDPDVKRADIQSRRDKGHKSCPVGGGREK